MQFQVKTASHLIGTYTCVTSIRREYIEQFLEAAAPFAELPATHREVIAAQIVKLANDPTLQTVTSCGYTISRERNFNDTLRAIPRETQRQDSTIAQLSDLRDVANKLGMHDAADFLRNFLESRKTT